MKGIEWLRPFATAVAKSTGITDDRLIAETRHNLAQSANFEAIAMEDLADQTGEHIALSAAMIEWLMQVRVEGTVSSGGWHLPYRALRIGVEYGSQSSALIACWLKVQDYRDACPPIVGAPHLPRHKPDDWVLYVGIRGFEPDGTPAVVRALLDEREIADAIRGDMQRAPELQSYPLHIGMLLNCWLKAKENFLILGIPTGCRLFWKTC